MSITSFGLSKYCVHLFYFGMSDQERFLWRTVSASFFKDQCWVQRLRLQEKPMVYRYVVTQCWVNTFTDFDHLSFPTDSTRAHMRARTRMHRLRGNNRDFNATTVILYGHDYKASIYCSRGGAVYSEYINMIFFLQHVHILFIYNIKTNQCTN